MKNIYIFFIGLFLSHPSQGALRSFPKLHQHIKTIYTSLGDHYGSLFKDEFCHTIRQIAQQEGVDMVLTDEQLMEYASLQHNPAYSNLKGAEKYFIEAFNESLPRIMVIILAWSNQPSENIGRLAYALLFADTLIWIFKKLDPFVNRILHRVLNSFRS